MEPTNRPVSENHPLRVAVVGPCAAGKSTLIACLRDAGYEGKHVAQEHSYVQDMWQRITKPDVLIYLDISYKAQQQRRRVTWGTEWLAQQSERLAHARQHCDLYIATDSLTADEVTAQVLTFLAHWAA